eukprot:2528199-Lingulodinium_polyedra.AAC.1
MPAPVRDAASPEKAAQPRAAPALAGAAPRADHAHPPVDRPDDACAGPPECVEPSVEFFGSLRETFQDCGFLEALVGVLQDTDVNLATGPAPVDKASAARRPPADGADP